MVGSNVVEECYAMKNHDFADSPFPRFAVSVGN